MRTTSEFIGALALFALSLMASSGASADTQLRCVSSAGETVGVGTAERITGSGEVQYLFQVSQKAVEGRLKSKTPQALAQLARAAANDAFFQMYKKRKGEPTSGQRLSIRGAQARELVCGGQRVFVYGVSESNWSWVDGSTSGLDADPLTGFRPSLQDALDL
jgi:hypothetical protein